MPYFIVPGATFVGITLVLWFNIRLLRRKVSGWRNDLIPIFIMAIGNGRASPARVALWTGMGFSEVDARIIIQRQVMCLLEAPVGFVVGFVLLAVWYR